MANSYTNAGGSGPRSYITVTTTASVNGVITALVNGTQANECWFAAGQSGHEVRFVFPVPRNITEAKWYQDDASTHGGWKWQGSNDGSVWTDIGGMFTLGGTLQTMTSLSANTDFWRYYRLLQMSGVTSSNPYLREIEFNIDDTVLATAMLTQIAVEQWGIVNPDVLLTQIAVEQWGTVASLVPPSFSARHV